MDQIAIIGLAARLPGAADVGQFWRNQLAGLEAISRFSIHELEGHSGLDRDEKATLVRARSILADIDLFDAEFFGINPREAELMDPQQRVFMEICWQALEAGGYDPHAYAGEIGLYAGASLPTYLLSQLCRQPGFIDRMTSDYQVGSFTELIGNGLDFLSTRIAYKLNLRGPCMTVLSACSTSLLSVAQAAQSLLTYQCDMALAGGVSISLPQKRGTAYLDGGMTSADGHVRTFDAAAGGTVFGSGAAVVLLKRLEDAIADGDTVHAVIRGYGVNNDGARKAGYTAPSADGQARVIGRALDMAGVEAASIGYIEAHGTGTPLGDPIELAALDRAFRAQTDKTGFCTIGTAKTNVGHLDAAAGVTGLINAVHIVREGMLPPTLHYSAPNPNFDLNASPFKVATSATPWTANGAPRRAGISAFGVGGTNVHVVIEQAPPAAPRTPARAGPHLLLVSARSPAALDANAANLAAHISSTPDIDLSDVAWTLQAGRRNFPYRRFVVAETAQAAANTLRAPGGSARQHSAGEHSKSVYFLFPGQGAQRLGMGEQLYREHSEFRAAFDTCAEKLKAHIGADLRTLLHAPTGDTAAAATRLKDTLIAQPAIFATEYALAKLWISWGIRPAAMLGHSVGEFVAACIAGVFSLDDALMMVAARGRLMQALPPGAMLAVSLSEQSAADAIAATPASFERVSIAAINGPRSCVVAGTHAAIDEIEARLTKAGAGTRRLVTSHAFHSSMMDAAIGPFRQIVDRIRLSPPATRIVSSVTGTWLTSAEATDPNYWARHLRQPVRFSDAVSVLRKDQAAVLLEVGPGGTLSALARQHHVVPPTDQVVVASLPYAEGGAGEAASVLTATGSLWAAGVTPNWCAIGTDRARRRVPLPTYAFERRRFWLETGTDAISEPALGALAPEKHRGAAPQDPARTALIELAQDRNVTVASEIDSSATTAAVRAQLAQLLGELSGSDIASVAGSATFVELGFDSLFLTQVSRALQQKLQLKVSFRQLMNDIGTLDALTAHVVANAPPSSLPAAPKPDGPPPMVASPTTPADAITSRAQTTPDARSSEAPQPSPHGYRALDQIVADQLATMQQIFARQLDAAQGVIPVVAPAVAPIANRPTAPIAAPDPQPTTRPAITSEKFKPFGPYRPLQTGTAAEIGPEQKSQLAWLIGETTRRTPKSKGLTQQHRTTLADPRAVSGFRDTWKEMIYPVTVDRSQGSRLWDVDGNEYVDLLNGFGPIMFGHRADFVVEAMQRQLAEGFEIGPQTPLAGEIAEMFCAITGNERMTFCNTGSEAVMAALRVARTVTGRDKVVTFAGDYHGMFDEVLIKPARNAAGQPSASPIAPGIPRESVANMIVLDYATPESLAWIRGHADELAAVIVEPVQSRHPGLQPIEFLREVRQITQASGTALVFDEIVTGFRAHPGGCQALFDIRADMATYGKVLGGGMPIGVLAGRAEFMDALDGGGWRFGDASCPEVGVTFFAGTFVRHPLTLAAVKAVLQRIQAEGPALQERLATRTENLATRINAIFTRYAIPARVEHFASIFYFAMPPQERYASLFYAMMRLNGVHILEGFPCFMSVAHSDQDINLIATAFERSAQWMRQSGFLSTQPAELPATGVTAPPLPIASKAQPIAAMSTQPTTVRLTEAQREIFLASVVDNQASCAFNEGITLDLEGPLDLPALQRAIDTVRARHDSLRAVVDDNGTTMTIAANSPCDLRLTDLSGLPEAAREAEYASLVEAETHIPFVLAKGPLWRSRLVRLAPDRHRLLATAHHIVCDGWSTNVILEETGKLYSATIRGANADLGPAIPFSAFANNEAERNQRSVDRDTIAYWLKELKDAPSPLELPTDRPRQSQRSTAGATTHARVDANAYALIKQAGQREGASLFVTLLSGFVTLLNRMTQQHDIVVGVPFAGQARLDDTFPGATADGETPALVGHCVNFLPLRTRLAAEASFATLLRDVKTTVLNAYDHQHTTYGTLIRELGMPRDPSRLPLTEVQFNVEQFGNATNFVGLKASVRANAKAAVNFDLFFNIVEHADGLTIDCDYNTDLYDRTTIDRWLSHYTTLLQDAARDTAKPLSRLALLPAAEREKLVSLWNATEAVIPNDTCIHSLIEQQTARTPDDVAVIFGDERLTYGRLDARANQLANYLVASGLKPSERVAVLVERSPEMLISLLAVMKAGATYVPLDPTFPKDRIAFVLADAKATYVLTSAELAAAWAFENVRVVALDRDAVGIRRASESRPRQVVSPRTVAYVIYTSGSTGKPKGVMIDHRAVVNFLLSMQLQPGLTKADTFAAVTTLSFDIAGLELYLPLTVGAKLVIASREHQFFASKLLEMLQANKVTAMQATPVTWRLLIEAGWTAELPLKAMCGGEAFPLDLANAMLARSPSVWNMYGPTETTIWSAVDKLERGASTLKGPILVGRPIANTQFYVLDVNLQLAPIGVPGELHIAGDGVALGYHDRPELTREKFIPDPFAPVRPDGTRPMMYKTGDLARFCTDGRLEFQGRLDHQIKLRGFRIELGEIETTLETHPNVRAAVVALREDVPGDKRLVGYIVPKSGPIPSTGTLRQFIEARLPAYMAPTAFVELAELPHTPNGKIDRRALPAPDRAMAQRSAQKSTVAETTEEKQLGAICAEVLGIPAVGAEDNLFELGADSLGVFQITSRAQKAGLNVTLKAILKTRTVRGILTDASTSATAVTQAMPAIVPVSRDRFRVPATAKPGAR